MLIMILFMAVNLPTAIGTDEMPAHQAVDMTLRHDILDRLRFGTCQSMTPMDAPSEELLDEPAYRSGHPLYYAAGFGDGQDRITTFVVDESGGNGTGYDTFYVDSNNDNRIDGAAEKYDFKSSRGSRPFAARFPLSFTTQGKTVEHRFTFAAHYYKGKEDQEEILYCRLEEGSYFSGEAVIAGERRSIAIADMDSNGFFNDPEESLFHGDRFFVDLHEPYTEGSLSSFAYGDYTEILGEWYCFKAAPEGSRVEIMKAEPALGTVTAPAGVISATLRSATQTLELDFSEGGDQGVVGAYRLHAIQLSLEDGTGKKWTNHANIKTGGPELVVVEGGTTPFDAGLPFRIEITVSQAPDREEAELQHQCIGSAGEVYGQWRIMDGDKRSSPELSFEILDENGTRIHGDGLEYG